MIYIILLFKVIRAVMAQRLKADMYFCAESTMCRVGPPSTLAHGEGARLPLGGAVA